MHVFAHDRCQANLSIGWLVCGCIFKFSHEVMSIGGYIFGKNKLNGPASLPITASYPLPPTRNRFRPKEDSRPRKDRGQNCASLHWIAYILIDGSRLFLPTKRLFHPIRQIFLGSIPNIEDRVYRLHTRAMGLWGYEILSFLAKNRQ